MAVTSHGEVDLIEPSDRVQQSRCESEEAAHRIEHVRARGKVGAPEEVLSGFPGRIVIDQMVKAGPCPRLVVQVVPARAVEEHVVVSLEAEVKADSLSGFEDGVGLSGDAGCVVAYRDQAEAIRLV